MQNLDSTKKRILLAAGPIFAKKGFRGATVREISDSAGVNLASINYYFGDKQKLYVDTVIYARNMRAQQVPDPQWEQGTSAEEKLRGYILLLLNRMGALQSAPWQVHLLMREILQPTDACRKLIHEYFQPFLQGLMALIDEIIGHEISGEARMQLAFSIVGQCMYYRFAGEVATMVIENEGFDNGFELENLANHISAFSLSGIRNMHLENSTNTGSIKTKVLSPKDQADRQESNG